MLRAKDIMTPEVVTISEEASVAEAIELMREEAVRCLIVEPVEEYEPYGIVTQRDICYKVIAQSLDPAEVKVAEVMSQPLVLVSPNFRINQVAKLMANTRLSRLPVIFNGKLQGIVSVTDVVDSL